MYIIKRNRTGVVHTEYNVNIVQRLIAFCFWRIESRAQPVLGS